MINLECPVCRMRVKQDQNVLEYQGMPFAFCSAQCRANFLAHPHLYVGRPGYRAPKQEGVEVIKQRRLHLGAPLNSAQAEKLKEILAEMMGVQQVVVESDSVAVTYDLLKVTAEQIERRLVEVGAWLGRGWAERLRRGWTISLRKTRWIVWKQRRRPVATVHRQMIEQPRGINMHFRKVIAIIRPDVLEQVESRLQGLGIKGMSVSQVKGYGEYLDFYSRDHMTSHLRIEVFAEQSEAEAIASAIMEAAHVGLPGDGIVAIQPVEKLYRIHTQSEAVPGEV